jgi:hypothetical protein
VPHGCGKEQEGELAVEAPMADRNEQPGVGTARDLYSRPAPCPHDEVMRCLNSLALRRPR